MPPSYGRGELVRQLGATVGDAAAAAAVDDAAGALGLMGESWDKAEALRLLDELGARTDIVGIAAKLVRVRVVLTDHA